MTDYPVSAWPHGISLEVRTQDPAVQAFRLDASPLDSASLSGDADDLFRLDVSALDADTLGPPPPPLVWWDITGPSMSVSTLVGVRNDSPLSPPETGTLTAVIRDRPNLVSAGVRTGTPLRLRHGDTPLWFGHVDDIATVWDKAGGSTTTVTGSDWISSAARITRYGRQVSDETALYRFNHLIWESLDEPMPAIQIWNLDLTGQRIVCPIVDEVSLSDHLQMAANSGNFVWASLPQLETSSAIIRPRLHSNQNEGQLWSDVDGADRSFLTVAEGAATSQIVNSVEVTQHTMSWDDQGHAQAVTSQRTVTNQASVANWGTRPATLDISVALASDVDYAAGELLSGGRDITSTVTDMTVRGADWAALAAGSQWTIVPLAPMLVRLRGVTHRLVIASVSHDITPTDWTTRITFLRRTD